MTEHKHNFKVQPRGLFELIGNTIPFQCESCKYSRWLMRGTLYRMLRGDRIRLKTPRRGVWVWVPPHIDEHDLDIAEEMALTFKPGQSNEKLEASLANFPWISKETKELRDASIEA